MTYKATRHYVNKAYLILQRDEGTIQNVDYGIAYGLAGGRTGNYSGW